MIRNLKVLGLAAMAVLALSAFGASAASAEGPYFTADEYPAFMHGATSNTVFEATGIDTVCNSVTFEAELNEASETLTVAPTYTGCTGFFGISITVTGTGHYGEEETCDYLLHTETEQTNPPGATVDIVCEGDAEITIESNPCTIHIPPQTGLETWTLTNNTPAAGRVRADMNITGIHGTMTRNNFLCPTHGGTFNDGTYTGTMDLEGENQKGEAIGIDVG